jgi:hypothetical protein
MILEYLSSIVFIAKDLRFHYFLVFFRLFIIINSNQTWWHKKMVTWQKSMLQNYSQRCTQQKNEIIPSDAGTLVSVQDNHQL